MPNSGINLWKLNLWPSKGRFRHETTHNFAPNVFIQIDIAPTRKRRFEFHEKLAVPGKIILHKKKNIGQMLHSALEFMKNYTCDKQEHSAFIKH